MDHNASPILVVAILDDGTKYTRSFDAMPEIWQINEMMEQAISREKFLKQSRISYTFSIYQEGVFVRSGSGWFDDWKPLY